MNRRIARLTAAALLGITGVMTTGTSVTLAARRIPLPTPIPCQNPGCRPTPVSTFALAGDSRGAGGNGINAFPPDDALGYVLTQPERSLRR